MDRRLDSSAPYQMDRRLDSSAPYQMDRRLDSSAPYQHTLAAPNFQISPPSAGLSRHPTPAAIPQFSFRPWFWPDLGLELGDSPTFSTPSRSSKAVLTPAGVAPC
jgi:hypothetical protein